MNTNEKITFGDNLSDKISGIIGSWKFIIIQTVFIIIWISLNIYGLVARWDSYPFILLNLFMSLQAAYTAPIIMMSQNRMETKDRERAIHDLNVDISAEHKITNLQKEIQILNSKIDRLTEILDK